ncbi:hypothetical protein [Pseudomonas asplenii]|uniref:hypothetical protein n=1 Tax=Pseudomonas asplenii TaxID=53407 RepID=UPI00037494E6|nr:hypothetical protein [Pseudomonas fuscovaginae]
MKSTFTKVTLALGSLLLGACSSDMSTHYTSACSTLSCQQHYNSSARLSQDGGSMNRNLGSSFSEYGESMLRD